MSTLRLNGTPVTLNGVIVTLNGADAGDQTLTPTLFSDLDWFGAHSVAPGPVSLGAGLITDPDWFGLHAVQAGPVTLLPAAYTDPDWFGAHSISTGSGLQTLGPTAYIDQDWFGAHAVSLSSNTQALIAVAYLDPDWFGVTDPIPEPEEGDLPVVTIPELPAQASGNVSDDDLMVMLDVGSGEVRKVSRSDLLTGVARSGLPASLGATTATSLAAPSGAIDALTVATGLVIGATLQRVLYSASSVAVPTVGAGAQGTVTVTITGAVTTDHVTVSGAAIPAGLIMRAEVTSANTVTLYFWNGTAASIPGANYTLRVMVERVV